MKILKTEIFNFEQRSREWHEARLGILTASNFYDATRYLKNGNRPAARYHLMKRLAIERYTGELQSGYVNEAMMHGAEMEAEVAEYIEIFHPGERKNIGFCRVLTEHGYIGISPDLVFKRSGFLFAHEIKCPFSLASFDDYENKIPEKNFDQCLAYLWLLSCDAVTLNACIRDGESLKFHRKTMCSSSCPGMKKNSIGTGDIVLRSSEYADAVERLIKEVELFLIEFNEFNQNFLAEIKG